MSADDRVECPWGSSDGARAGPGIVSDDAGETVGKQRQHFLLELDAPLASTSAQILLLPTGHATVTRPVLLADIANRSSVDVFDCSSCDLLRPTASNQDDRWLGKRCAPVMVSSNPQLA